MRRSFNLLVPDLLHQKEPLCHIHLHTALVCWVCTTALRLKPEHCGHTGGLSGGSGHLLISAETVVFLSSDCAFDVNICIFSLVFLFVFWFIFWLELCTIPCRLVKNVICWQLQDGAALIVQHVYSAASSWSFCYLLWWELEHNIFHQFLKIDSNDKSNAYAFHLLGHWSLWKIKPATSNFHCSAFCLKISLFSSQNNWHQFSAILITTGTNIKLHRITELLTFCSHARRVRLS